MAALAGALRRGSAREVAVHAGWAPRPGPDLATPSGAGRAPAPGTADRGAPTGGAAARHARDAWRGTGHPGAGAPGDPGRPARTDAVARWNLPPDPPVAARYS